MSDTVTQKQNKRADTFKYGTIDSIEARSIPRGAARASLNWLTLGDKIELRRGSRFLGTSSVNTGLGKATGIKTVTRATDIERLFGTYGKKIKYFDTVTDEWIEIGTDLLGTGVIGSDGIGTESISLQEYVGLAGNQLFVNSPNCSGFYKIMVANPTSYTDMYDGAKNFKGLTKIDTNRTLLWQRVKDQTGLYGSYIDAQSYTTVTAEILGTGNGVAVTFTGTLSYRAGNPKNTCFGISVTDGVETFTDNYDGTLTGSLGGTGTINYTTGAISVTFNTAVVNLTNVTVTYQHENSNANGITDFTKSATRLAGEGFILRQDESGGKFQSVKSYNNVYYCLHTKRTWALTLAIDDSPSGTSNVPYRHKVGIPNDRAAVETGKGIYYIDETDGNDTKIRLLTYDTGGSQQVIPVPVSNNININDYTFDQGASFKYGNFICFAGRLKTSTVNNRTLVFNDLFNCWDILDYAITCMDTYEGALVAGDALSDNFMELFSGVDDLGSPIFNYWEGKMDDLDIDGLKKSKRVKIIGDIGPDQKMKVSVSLDNGPFVEIRTADDAIAGVHAIEGSGSYVDRGQRVSVGPETLGKGEVGGGGSGIEAYHYEREFSIGQDDFEEITFRFEGMELGYLSVSAYEANDVRFKGKKTPRKYRG